MKILILTLLGVAFSCNIFALSDSITEISFTYDAAGNRTNREIVYYVPQQKSAKVVNYEEEMEFEEGLHVYPNPTKNCLFVTLNQEALEQDQRMILVYDNVGKLVLQTLAPHEINKVDVSLFTSGTYILKLIYGKKHNEWIIIKN